MTVPKLVDPAALIPARLARAGELLQAHGVHGLLVTPSADLTYFTGKVGHPTDRPVVLLLAPNSESVIVVPQLEASGWLDINLQVVTYGETEDPIELIAGLVRSRSGGGRLAISDQAWSSVLLALQSALPRNAFEPASVMLAELRAVKDDIERAALMEAGRRADAVFESLCGEAFGGRTEDEMASRIIELLPAYGLIESWQPIVGSGPNSASPHHGHTGRVIGDNEPVVLDFGGMYGGYQADMTRTVFVGQPPARFVEVYELVRAAQEAGVQAARPGVEAEVVDAAARDVIRAGGFGPFFIHRTGHGIGIEIHEHPYIVEGNHQTLQPGNAFSVEPGVYLPGEFGVRIEDIVVLDDARAMRCTEADRTLRVVS